MKTALTFWILLLVGQLLVSQEIKSKNFEISTHIPIDLAIGSVNLTCSFESLLWKNSSWGISGGYFNSGYYYFGVLEYFAAVHYIMYLDGNYGFYFKPSIGWDYSRYIDSDLREINSMMSIIRGTAPSLYSGSSEVHSIDPSICLGYKFLLGDLLVFDLGVNVGYKIALVSNGDSRGVPALPLSGGIVTDFGIRF